MDCASCGRENRDDARFCAGCGTPVPSTCAVCSRQLAPDARFCDGCGTPVAAATGPGPAPNEADAVRKTVTAVFCDLVGSTTFGETVDQESAREAMARYHAMASTVIEGQGGTVAKFIGDGVMALFGVPEVAEDDAERAVATGLDLQRSFEPIQRHVADRYGVELGLRVGVNTGEVVIAADDADIVGDALNTAARLEASCEPGGVLVGESTWRLTRATVKYDPLGSVEVKGKAEPVATYRVIAEQAAEDELATPFLGRDAEMAVLTSTFADAVEAGEARFVTVVGSPGVGKTRLAAELVRGLGQDVHAFDLRCERAGTATFAPVADLLREAAAIDDGMSAEVIGDRIEALVGSAGDGERVAELLGGFVGATPARSTEEMLFAVRRLIEILGRDRPVVVVVDDIQWAEPLFLDLLEHLAEWVNEAPALIVGLARPEIREVRSVLAEPGRRVTEVISLEGLDSDATEQLAAALVGGRTLPAELAARLPSSTEGNPLFVRELMRMLVDDGVIVDSGDSWALAIDAEAIEVPPTINSLLATRVERLSDADRRVLELAAVVGPEFPRGAVGAVAGALSGSEIDAALERLRRRELVEPTGSYWGDEPVFRFHHVLIRDAAYRRLLKIARAELHVAVGEWTEATAAGLVGEHDVAIGFHFEQAHDYRLELDLHDDETASLGRRAAALFRTAAERALERDDLAAAGALAARALACLEADDPSLAPLLLVGCEALLGTGAVAEGGPLVERLAGVAVGDERLAAWADCYRAELRVLADPDGLVEAERAANAAAERLAALDDRSGVAKARLVRAQALARLARVGDCEAELDEALGAARAAGDDRRVTSVLGAAPMAALWGPSPIPRAGGRCLDVIRLLRITTGSPAVEAVSVRCQAVLEALRGRDDTARAMLQQARGTLEELGLRQGLLETELYAGIVELLAGSPAAAEPHLRAAYGGLGQLGIGADVGQAAAHLARALMELGRLDEARELADESETLAGQNLQTLIAARSVRAEILAATGSIDEAIALADGAVALASDSDILVDHANAVAAQARVRVTAGDMVGAAAAAATAADLYDQKGAVVEVRGGADVTPAGATAAGAVEVEPAVDRPADGTDGGVEWWNEAHRRFVDAIESFAAGDGERFDAMIADDAVHDDRRRGVHVRSEGREAVLNALVDASQLDRFQFRIDSLDPVATRGDDLILGAVRIRDERRGHEVEWLSIDRWNADGLIDRMTVFDAGDLSAAVAELDRLYGETLSAVDAAWNQGFALTYSALSAKDLDTFLATYHPSLEVVDHRQLGWPAADFDDFAERVATLVESVDRIVAYIERFHVVGQVSRGWAARYRITMHDGSTIDDRHLLASRVDPATGLVVRAEQFADSDLSSLLARVGELERSVSPAARARVVRVGALLSSALRDGEAVEPWLAHSFLPLEGPGGGVVATGTDPGSLRAAGFGGVDREVVAVRGERLALIDVGLGDGTRRYQVEEIDEEDRIVRVRQFGSDQLVGALDHLDERWLELDGALPEGVGAGLELTRRARHGDVDGVAAILVDDFVAVDHRAGGFGRLDGQSLVALTPTTGDDPMVLVARCILRMAEEGSLSVADLVPLDPAAPFEPVRSLTVSENREGKVARLDFFHDDDLAAAIARFDELTREARETFAERASRRLMERHHAGDLDGFAALVAPDAVHEDRRARIASAMTREDLLEATRWLIEEGMVGGTNQRSSTESLATWGARHLAMRQVLERPGGFRIEVFSAVRHDLDGRSVRSIGTETEAEALAALDELVAEELRSPELVNTMTMLFERMDGFAGGTVLAVRGDLLALVERLTGESSDLVIGVAATTGEVIATEFFAADDLAAAVDRLNELWLDGEAADVAGMDVIFEWGAAIRANDPVRLDRVLDDGLVGESNARLSVKDFTKQGFLEDFAATSDVPGTVVTKKVHAIGDHHCVVTAANCVRDAPGQWREVSMVNHNVERGGRLIRFDQWAPEDLPVALARFDERRRDLEAPTFAARASMRYADTVESDPVSLRDVLADDYVVEDRRRGLGSSLEGDDAVDRTADLAGAATRTEVLATAGARHVVTRDLYTTADGYEVEIIGAARVGLDGRAQVSILTDTEAEARAALAELVGEELRSPELVNTMTMLFQRTDRYADAEVIAVRDDLFALARRPVAESSEPEFVLGVASPLGEIDSIETFSDPASALDRLDAVAGMALARRRPHHLLGLEGPELEAALRDLASTYADDYRLRSHRRLGSPELDVDGEQEFWRASAELGLLGITQKYHAVAPGLAVIRATTATEEGATIPIVALRRTTEDGRVASMDTWDVVDLPVALARFDELVAPTPTLAERVVERSDAAVARGDLEAFASGLASDYRAEDRRSMMAQTYDRDLAVANAPSLRDQRGETIATRGARLVARRFRIDNEGFVNDYAAAFRVTLDGTCELAVVVESEADALAVLDELETEEMRSPELVNTMTMLFERTAGAADVKVLSVRGDLIAMVERTTEAGHSELAVGLASPTADVVSVDTFPVDQLEAAATRLLELVSEQGLLGPGSAVWLAYGAALSAGDVEAVGRVVHDDLVLRNAQSLFPDVDDKAGMLTYLEENIDTLGITYPRKILADAPDRILMWVVHDIRSGDGSAVVSELLALNQARDGKIALLEEWGLDDLPAALARFDELGAADERESLQERTTREMLDALNRGDLDALRDGLSGDFHVEDRRPGMPGYDVRDSLAIAADGVGRSRWECELVHSRGARHGVLHVIRHEEGQVVENWRANRIDLDGRTEWSIIVESEADAIAALDELVAEELRSPELVNTMTMLFERMDGYDDADVVAVAGDLSAILRRGGADRGTDREFVLGWASPAGSIERIDEMGFGDLRGGLVEWTAAGWVDPDEIGPVFIEYARATDSGDVARLESLLDPAFEVQSHRRLVNTMFDRREFLAYMEVLSPEGVFLLAKVHAAAPSGVVVSSVRLEPSPGREITVSPQVTLVRSDGVRVLGSEIWDPEELPSALARFDHLAAYGDGGVDSGIRTNRAVAVIGLAADLQRAGQYDRLGEVMEDDVSLEDRRATSSFGLVEGLAAAIEQIRSTPELGLGHPEPPEILAVRGDDHVMWRAAPVDDGTRIEQLLVQSLGPGGRLHRTVIFDPDDVMAAQDELNRAWAGTLDPEPAESMRLANEWITSLMGGDVERMDQFLTPDFVLRDLRPLGLGDVDRSAFVELIRQRPAIVGDGYTIVSDTWLFDDAVVAPYRMVQENPDGFSSTEEGVTLFRGEAGSVSYLATYPPEELDRALADAQAAARSRPRARVAARDLVERLVEHIATGRLDRLDEVLEDDIVLEDRRSVVTAGPRTGRQAFRDMVTAGHDIGLRQVEREEVAARGDSHLLTRSALVGHQGERIERLVLHALGRSGKLGRRVDFDPDDLPAAQDELDRQWMASLDADERATWGLSVRVRDAILAGDADALDGFLAPDFSSADARRSGRWDLDRSAFLAMVADRPATIGSGFQLVADVQFVGTDVLVTTYEIRTTSPQHGIVAVDAAVAVGRSAGGRADRLDLFDLDRFDDARAHAEELAAELRPN